MTSYRFFGYGSLINEASLRRTVPEAENITPVSISGFYRIFSVASPYRYCYNSDVYASVLNVRESTQQTIINGVCFDVPESYYEQLMAREECYNLVEVEAWEFHDQQRTYRAYLFMVPDDEEYPYQSGEPEQEEYLHLCLEGCKTFGERFLEMFKRTTYLNGKTLRDWGY